MTQEQARPQNSEPATRGLAGKVAMLTRASRGIGRAIAERLARDGAKVVVNYVNNEEAAGRMKEGGRIVNISRNIGYPGPDAWRGRIPRLDYDDVVRHA